MTPERFDEISENTESELHNVKGDNAFLGLQILSKYVSDNLITGAEHDKIYSVDVDEILDELTEQDVITLFKMNWMYDEEFGCFACFV